MIRLGGLINSKAFGKFEQGKVYSNPYAKAFTAQPNIKEAEDKDHEVSMAQNSLDAIIKNATELKSKLGEMEKNIPGWIQDHITNSENYIEQANSGYHELTERKINEMGPNDVHYKEIMKFYDKGTPSTKRAVSIYVTNKPNASKKEIGYELGGMDYNEIWDVMDHFKLTLESNSIKEDSPCWQGYKQVGMKTKNGRQVPNCVPEGIVKEGRGLKTIEKEFFAVSSEIQDQILAYKKYKGTDKEKSIVSKLKDLNDKKKRLEKEMDSVISGLYKDAELKVED